MATKLPPSIPSSLAETEARIAALEQRVDRCELALIDVARRIDEMAKDLGYPITSVELTRVQLHEIARIIRLHLRPTTPAKAEAARHG